MQRAQLWSPPWTPLLRKDPFRQGVHRTGSTADADALDWSRQRTEHSWQTETCVPQACHAQKGTADNP